MDESQSINVVFCFDKNFVNCTTVAIFSLLKNSKSPIHLHLIVSDIPDGALAPIKELASTYQATLLIYRPENFAQYEWKTLNHWTEATYLRLIIPDLIDVDKIIYLDGDVIVTQDLLELYSLPLDGSAIAGALEKFHFNFSPKILGSKDEPYINTGVMLMDLKRLREDNFFNQCLEINRDYHDLIIGVDQDIINKYAEGRKKILDIKWNTIAVSYYLNASRFRHFVDSDRAILHFQGPIKPWMEWCNQDMIDFWMSYAKLSPLKNIALEKITSYAQAMYKIIKLEEEGDYYASGLIKNRIMNTLTKEEKLNLPPIAGNSKLIRNALIDHSPAGSIDTLAEITDLLFNA